MITAVIDIGTNTFHLLIVDRSGETPIILHKEKIAVRLGKDGISQGYINEEAIERAIATLKNFMRTIQKYDPNTLTTTATSAVRNAGNSDEFVKKVFTETGIKIQVLSGEQEALYIYKGVTEFLELGAEPVLIMDIGGGSIEFIVATKEGPIWMKSFEIGGQRLMDKFHINDPISKAEILSLENFLSSAISEVISVARENDVKTLVGVSGTFDTLQDISTQAYHDEGAIDNELDIRTFDVILNDLIIKNRMQRLNIPGMIPMRVDMIVVALILTNYVLKEVGVQKIRISNYALKEGILYHPLSDLPVQIMKA